MGRTAQIAIGLYVAWLVVFAVLQSSPSPQTREFASLWGAILIFGPLLAIALLSAAVWLERRLKRR